MHESLGWRALGWWTVAFCVHRAAILWWGFDGVFYWEETYRLLIGEALWHRWSWPLLDLQADPYAGGSLVFGALAVPLIATVGSNVIGLKAIALVWNAVGFATWTAFVDRWWGRRAAQLFALFFVLGPPLLVVYGLIAMGSHAEVGTLVGVDLVLAYRVLYAGRPSVPAIAAWGVAAGLSAWFTYDALLPFAVCVGVGVASGVLRPRRLLVLASAFVLGLAPWVATNLASSGRGLEVVSRTFGSGTGAGRSAAGMLEMLAYLVHTGIPLALGYPDVFATVTGGAPRRLLLAHLFFAFYVGSWSILAWSCVRRRLRDAPEVPLLVLFPAVVLLLAMSDQVFLQHERVWFLSFRVLVPFLPVVIATIAAGAARAPAVGRWLVVAVLLTAGIAGSGKQIAAGAHERPAQVANARTLGATAAGHLLFYKHGFDVETLTERIDAMPVDLRDPAWEGAGFSLAYHFPDDVPLARFVEELRQIPAPYVTAAVRGVRAAVGDGMEQVMPRAPTARARALLDGANSVPRGP